MLAPRLIAAAGEKAARRFLEFFAATIRNKNTRMAYYRAVVRFFAWCDRHTVSWLACIAALGAPIDQDDCTWTLSGEPRLSGVADDREHARGCSWRTVERFQRGHASVLHDVFGVRRAARQPARQRRGVVQMRPHQFREAPPRGFAHHMSPSACQGVAVILPFICGCWPQK
jgi:hypothetical protein